MDKIISILYKIKSHPGMYIEKKSIKNLKVFLNGYYIGIYENDRDFSSVFDSFQHFIMQKYNDNRSLSWSDIISEDAKNAPDAFNVFYDLLEEYLSKYYGNQGLNI